MAKATKKKASLDIKSIAAGKLVGNVRDVVVEFFYDGKLESVEVFIKQLPYSLTEKFQKRMNEQDPSVIADWIAAALVNESGENYLTAQLIEDNFTSTLVSALYIEVTGLKQLQEYSEKLGKESALKKNSGQN